MSQRAATITSLPAAFRVVKAIQADGLEWSEGFRPAGRQLVAGVIERQMARAVDRHLGQLDADDAADRRNGYYRRHLLTELGDIELNVPRTRCYSPIEVVHAYARRTAEIDRVILSAFVLGLSTRKVGETLLALLGRPVSASTVRGCQEPRHGGGRFPSPAAAEPLQGADARRRCARPQDRRRRGAAARFGGFGHPPGRQEGGHRLPASRKRERSRRPPRRARCRLPIPGSNCRPQGSPFVFVAYKFA
jgi:hypothetical protein